MKPMGNGVHEAALDVDSMLEWSAKGVHESFLGGRADGKAFVAKVMIDAK